MDPRPLLFTCGLLAAGVLNAQHERTLEFVIDGAGEDTIYLANYVGNKLFYADTAIADAVGRAVFAREKGYPGGVYAVVVPGPKYFEIIVNEPEVVMRTTTGDLLGDLVVEKSSENRRFLDYIRFLDERKERSAALMEQLNATEDPIRKSTLRAAVDTMNAEVERYQQELIAEDPDALVARVVRMSMPVKLDPPTGPDGRVDSLAAYYQYREHFWDHTDLKDPRILRTPVFGNKLEEYFSKVVPQVPDTINRLADDLIARLGDDRDLYRYVVHYITYTFETSDIMGMDAVFVHMAKTYYCEDRGSRGKAFWMPEDKLAKLCERAEKLAPLVIGADAAPLILPDTSEQRWIASHTLPQEFVVICFWDPHCGHCKKEVPELHQQYVERLKGLDVEVYAVAKATDSLLFHDWRRFIEENKLDWVNVGLTWNVYTQAKQDAGRFIPRYTTLESLNYAETYDVYSTPKVFVLDGDRKIIGKQLSAEQIADLIERIRSRSDRTGG